MISGNVTYPRIGSIIAHERGAAEQRCAGLHPHRLPQRQPRPRLPRRAKPVIVYLTDTESGPAGFTTRLKRGFPRAS
jgi:hypothetical protein